MAAAIVKLTAHVANPRKFRKASALLRQLLHDNKVGKAHGNLMFEVWQGIGDQAFQKVAILAAHKARHSMPLGCVQALRATMRDPAVSAEPTLVLEYQKLFTAASKSVEVSSPS